MAEHSIQAILKRTSLLGAVSEDSLSKIAEKATVRRFQPEDYIYRIGEESTSMHVILSGEVRVVNDSGEAEIPIAIVPAGETIGEMGLLEGVPRAATIRAIGEVEALELREEVIEAFLNESSISLDAIKMVTRRLRDSNTELEKRFSQLIDLYKQLEENYTSTVLALSNALELRDKVTAGHSDRVTAYSLIMGKSMGLTDREMADLRLGALLHDLGKIGVSDTILHKQGKLTDEEWLKMREHPALGKQIVEDIDFLEPAVPVIYCHHEKWTGGGYPQNLQGEAIPLGARIFALADVFDALSMERSYKQAWTFDDVMAEIDRSSGTHFDPTVVEHFKKQIDQICDVLEKSKAGKSIRQYVTLDFYKDKQ